MKNLLRTSLLLLIASTANASTFKPCTYLKAEAGANIFFNEPTRQNVGNVQFVGGVGVGYKFNPLLRADLNFHYREASKNKRKFAFYEPCLNIYHDIETKTIFTPYVTAGGGLGVIQYTQSETEQKKKITSALFVWNIGLGSKAQLSKNVDLDLVYKFTFLVADKKARDGLGFTAHQITLGLIWSM